MYSRVRPFAEAMYLVMTADAEIAPVERDALRGALRILSDGALSGAAMESMIDEFRRSADNSDRELQMDHVASELYGDADDVELGLALVAAVAMSDGGMLEAERAVIAELAKRLGVSSQRLQRLLDADFDG
jgi:tellurite resistance protein